MVDHYTKHILWYELGFLSKNDFIPETVDEVYSNHLYCMSWFYEGIYPFHSWEVEYDDYLRELVYAVLNCGADS